VHGGQHRSETDACDLLPLGGDNRTATNGYRNAGYGSALHSLDHALHNITAALTSTGMWNNTLFMLTADNVRVLVVLLVVPLCHCAYHRGPLALSLFV
jgi:arylsulfatase A-like enzyme